MQENLTEVGPELQTCSKAGLSLVRSGLIALEMARTLASPRDCLVHTVENLFALTFFRGFVFFKFSVFP